MNHKLTPTIPERRAMGARLRAAREAAGLSIDEVIAQLGPDTFRDSVTSAEHVGRFSGHLLIQLCRLYNVSADWLLDLDTKETP